jgi:hypothetical protein
LTAAAPGPDGILLFSFGTNVSVNPGRLYCLEPFVESGEDCSLVFYHFGYPRGTPIVNGKPLQGKENEPVDMWFREGAISQFPRFTAISANDAGSRSIKLHLTGQAGALVVIESSSDGKTWSAIQTNTLLETQTELKLTNADAPCQFFRAIHPGILGRQRGFPFVDHLSRCCHFLDN